MQPIDEASRKQKELIELVVVVILIGLISSIVSSYLSTFYFKGLPIGLLFIPVLALLTIVPVYLIIYPKQTVKTAIYTNFMVDRSNECMHRSPYAPFSVQYAELYWAALKQDKSQKAKDILTNLHDSNGSKLDFDFVESLLFLTLSGFEPYWASSVIEYYGYPTSIFSGQLGEETDYSDSTIYRFQKEATQKDDLLNFKNLKFENLNELLKDNEIISHFLGKTSLMYVYKPNNWLIFAPKGTKISTESKNFSRIIHFTHRYYKANISIQKNYVATGLPYGVRIKEKDYNEQNYFTSDFRLDLEIVFSPWLLINWRRKSIIIGQCG